MPTRQDDETTTEPSAMTEPRDKYGPSAPPDETISTRRHRQIDYGQASRRRRPPRYHHSCPLFTRPGWRGICLRSASKEEPAEGAGRMRRTHNVIAFSF